MPIRLNLRMHGPQWQQDILLVMPVVRAIMNAYAEPVLLGKRARLYWVKKKETNA